MTSQDHSGHLGDFLSQVVDTFVGVVLVGVENGIRVVAPAALPLRIHSETLSGAAALSGTAIHPGGRGAAGEAAGHGVLQDEGSGVVELATRTASSIRTPPGKYFM